ncbi:hypothetical protein VD173_002349 [Enterococcus faecium]|nr:hypothetical protein [Enterococcus faecium]EGP4991512.1 hypothetical protein [Enterococcus faecium]EME3440493.1 hypothetical protein [Enterococcus faecium]EME3484036.1 hypothetical protein [Enterococcus faecium]
MSNVVYQLTVEDVSHFLTNKEHLNEVVRRIQKAFSCMEEMKYFIQRVEEQLYMESETSQTKVTVSHNHLDVYKRRPETVKKGTELLRLETEKYIMNVYLERSELVENFVSYTICRKHYYSEYYAIFESMELMEEEMEELNSKNATLDDYYLVFTRFLTCGTESIVLIGMDYELAVPEAFLREYVEEVDNPGDDWYTTLTDFLDTYTYNDTEEIQNELDRKRMTYQRFERKKG